MEHLPNDIGLLVLPWTGVRSAEHLAFGLSRSFASALRADKQVDQPTVLRMSPDQPANLTTMLRNVTEIHLIPPRGL